MAEPDQASEEVLSPAGRIDSVTGHYLRLSRYLRIYHLSPKLEALVEAVPIG
jgi:hypothetical protein